MMAIPFAFLGALISTLMFVWHAPVELVHTGWIITFVVRVFLMGTGP